MIRATVLALALACGCADAVARGAYQWPAEDLYGLQEAWEAEGFPTCPDLELWVYEAPEREEREAICQRPKVAGCLVWRHPPGHPAQEMRPVAVVDPVHLEALVLHEATHAMEACAWGAYDYGHSGPQWAILDRLTSIPDGGL